MSGAQFARVANAISKNQPAFGVGIDNLNRFSRHGHLHIARLLRASTRHVFRGGNHGDHRHAGFQRRNRAHRTEHGGTAAHVVLHLLHVIGRLNRYAAGIERHSFAHKPQHWPAGPHIFGRVAQHNHARGFHAALRYADQRSHFQFGDFPFVENFHCEAGFFGHGFGARSKHSRSKAVGGLVNQIAREIRRFGDHAALIDCGGKVRA